MRSACSRVARIASAGLLAAVVVGIARALRLPRKPKPTGAPTWPALVDEPGHPQRLEPVHFQTPTPTTETDATVKTDETNATASAHPTTPSNTNTLPGTETPTDATVKSSTPWVQPINNQCPIDHPVKVTEGSMVFHVQGGAFYDRTVPWRCYATSADAESDGYRAAKR